MVSQEVNPVDFLRIVGNTSLWVKDFGPLFPRPFPQSYIVSILCLLRSLIEHLRVAQIHEFMSFLVSFIMRSNAIHSIGLRR